ncbi:MAG: NAD(P)-dependent oxidoreductase [Mesorhizobium sp.]|uniref:NAD-dependent epimerase/dehydratase family protein n=1 Tax=Mesorhizobium sp. TaxID=1871066 RepID=UPI00122BD186|nr:NAD(P)-dependent oxidoreductase [Mesorhizobium sp.]TIO52195.1 MAG: NAD(P)-dependent oxidoreductase [Mesorhizobium sp.]TIO60859.1 MAG: NAD(P)-dependent oxidoreductase [Mesorhizobium sp.]TJV65405.1 MAG: NAD(P)-dependent oxidoreductase [Mesorhizobium sp.]
MKNIVVTGGSGKAGRAVCRGLVEHGYSVLNVDVQASRDPVCPFYKVDLNDLGQVIDALQWGGGKDHPFRKFRTPDAVVHLAAIPAPDLMPDDVIFRNNVVTTYNVFDAAIRVGVRRIVWASSETTLGLPFSPSNPPSYAPIDEDHPMRPESAYSLSKDLGEEMARQMQRWNPETTFIGLRLSNVMEPSDYDRFSSWQDDPHVREWNCWGYIDARDCAQAVRKALHVDLVGADHFIIANADTVMEQESAELMKTVFPDVQFKREIEGRETLLSIDKARHVLGYEPEFNFGRI